MLLSGSKKGEAEEIVEREAKSEERHGTLRRSGDL